MMHYFWTRLAVDSHLVNQKIERRPDDVTARAIELWLNRSSKFYEGQTVDAPFKVMLMVSESYKHVWSAYKFPPYAELTTLQVYDWGPRVIESGAEVTLTRLDCDDSYSVDLFEFLATLPGYRQHLRVLYYWMRQYHVATRRMTAPVLTAAPQFCSIYYPAFPEVKPTRDDGKPGKPTMETTAPFYGIVGNHGKFPQQPHIDAPGCYALMRETGYNVVNRCGSRLKGSPVPVTWDRVPDPRFIP